MDRLSTGCPAPQASKRRGAEARSCGCRLYFIYPAPDAVLNQLAVVAGCAAPCTPVQLYLDGRPAGLTASNACGYWELRLPDPPADGEHLLQVVSGCESCCLRVTIDGGLTPVPTPIILYPIGLIPENNPLIRGTAQPGTTVRVCVDGGTCRTLPVGADGTWSWQYPEPLAEGRHVVTAVAIDQNGVESDLSYQFFETQAAVELSVTLERANEGNRFRTVGLELSVASPSYPLTLHYLMLPPGSPAPTAEEILHYTGPGLEDGTAAAGSVLLSAGGEVSLDLSGREGAAAGSLGLVDGYRYDVYLVARAGQEQTPVLSALNVRAMPFGGGRGTEQDPYRIHQLSVEDIQSSYPDLAADRSPVGVDDTARLLRNIDEMQRLYLSSGGKYGVRNSMALDYELTSPIDLAGYVAANGGTGWWALGFRGNDAAPTQFTGLLSGSGDQTPIRGLTAIRTGLHLYEGLFAYGYNAIFRGLALRDAVIRITRDPDPDGQEETRVGLLCAQMYAGTLEDISAVGAAVTVSSGVHESVRAGVGGLVWEAYDALTARGLYAENIRITVTGGGYRVGSLFGRLAYRGAGATVEDAVVRRCTIQAENEHVAGIAGQAFFPKLLRNLSVESCHFSGISFVGGVVGQYLALNPTGSLAENLRCTQSTLAVRPFDSAYCGGLVGQYNMEYAHTLRNCTVTDCTVTNGRQAGGFAGGFELTGPQTIDNCHVTGGSVQTGNGDAGGFAGEITYHHSDESAASPPSISNCTVKLDAPVSAQQNAGGFVGHMDTNTTAEYQILFSNCTTQAAAQCDESDCGGFAGSCKIGVFTLCTASGGATAQAYAGGFAGTALDCRFDRCSAAGAVQTQEPASGGFVGLMDGDMVLDSCTASGDVRSAAGSAGGVFGAISDDPSEHHEITVDRCQYSGSLQAGPNTGGIGGLCGDGAQVVIQNCLVTSPLIAGDTPTGRIAGGLSDSVTLRENYSSTADVRQDGAPKPIVDDPTGPDGGNLPSGKRGAV